MQFPAACRSKWMLESAHISRILPPMRRGLTLIELLLVLTVSGLLFGIALPRFATLADGLAVEQAAQHLVGAQRRARITAILESRQIVLTIAPESLVIRPGSGGPGSWRAPGPCCSRSRHTCGNMAPNS